MNNNLLIKKSRASLSIIALNKLKVLTDIFKPLEVMAGLPPNPQSPALKSSSDLLIDSHENDERNKNKQNSESNVLPHKNRGKSSRKRNSKQVKESEVKQTKQSDSEYLRELYGTDSTKSIEPKKKKKKRRRRRRPVNGFVFISVQKTFLILIQNDFLCFQSAFA